MAETGSVLAPGQRVSFRKTMTVAEQAMFTGISGNLGSLYVDVVKARAAGASGMIAFELVVAGLATTCLARLGGPARPLPPLDLKFPAPVPVGGPGEPVAPGPAIPGPPRARPLPSPPHHPRP